jgi:hypothetical protein
MGFGYIMVRTKRREPMHPEIWNGRSPLSIIEYRIKEHRLKRGLATPVNLIAGIIPRRNT